MLKGSFPENESKFLQNKLILHNKCLVSFDKQTTRESYKKLRGYTSPEGPHEGRFESFNSIHSGSSKYQKINIGGSFVKNTSRQQLELRESKFNLKNGNQYDVNIDSVRSKLAVGIIDFSRQKSDIGLGPNTPAKSIRRCDSIDHSLVE